MTIYELRKDDAIVFAFEIKNTSCSRRRVCSIVRKIPGANLTKISRFLSWFREEEFCKFQIGQVKFVAWEPYGDSSDYWIGPEDARWHPETEAVVRAFAEERLWEGPFKWIRRVCARDTRSSTYVEFEWKGVSASTPPGLEIALVVRGVLLAVTDQVRGLGKMSGLSKRPDYGWEFAIRIKGTSLLVLLRRVERWRIIIHPLEGPYALFRWWRRGDAEAALEKACPKLHMALVKDHAFSNVRWCTEKEFAGRHGNPTAGSPIPGEVANQPLGSEPERE